MREVLPHDTNVNPVEGILGLLVAITVLAIVAQRLGVAYPIVLVVGGLILGLVPGCVAATPW